MAQDIDTLIENKENQIYPFNATMEKLKLDFLAQTTCFAREWYRKTIKEYITKYPEVTLKMKEEKIANMKTNLNELVFNAEKTIQQAIDKPEVWWHKKPNPTTSINQYVQVADKYPESVDCAVRCALGQLGMILQDFGFQVTADGNAGEFGEFWFMQVKDTEQITPYYPHLLDWTPEMQQTIQKYNIQYASALEIFKELHELKEEKKRQQALERWDSM
ncbi:MAG: hypothetical protein NWF01_01250 [Candidatus Bathyarchaeota archaeon]|nr:hypothetical protein [Candidatus Bathyarchaeota archaeon]